MDAPRYSPVQNDYQTRPGRPGQSNSLSQQLEQLFGLIRRQHLLIVVIIASAMALGFVYLKITPPTYAAHARLIIDSSKVRALQQQTMPGTYFPMIDIAEINTQVELLESDSIGLSVVKNQHLTENTAFVGGTGEGPLRAAFAKLKGLFGVGTAKVPDTI